MSDASDTPPHQGLSEAEASRRLASDGPNELPAERGRSLLATLLGLAREPMLLLLVAAGALYLLLGDLREALTLLSFVVVVIAITGVQERRSERALAALRDLSSPRALVVREGVRRRIPGREVVRGDLIVLAEGDRVPADASLVAGEGLQVDESLLTGESAPVAKWPGEAPVAAPLRPGSDAGFALWSGTLVVRGHGIACVHATGRASELGRIGGVLGTFEAERTPLQRDVDRTVRRLAAITAGISALLIVAWRVGRGGWLPAVLAGLTLAMAMIPEELPVVLAVFPALGAWRLSRRRVLTRRLPALEVLGATTVLCVDKTGTLTENRMTIARLAVGSSALDLRDASVRELPEEFHPLVEFGILASQRDPFDPMERAFHALGQRALARTEHLHAEWSLVREYPLSPGLLALSHVWTAPEGGRLVIAAKGAPEAVADLCHLPEAALEALARQVEAMASEGLRVLAVARAYFARPELPGAQHDFDFELLGLVGLVDPVRASAPQAVAECHRAGVRVLMITGDHPKTALAIAREIGLPPAEPLLGPELERMDDAELQRRIRSASVVARAVPEHKLRIVAALRADGEIVAMTGDGVNDAPALQAAHMGIAMGLRGTDVAREAADLVLLDDDFASIVEAVRQGRRIFDNLRKAAAYILAVHVPIAGMSLLPVLLGWPAALLPVHVAFLELVIDPACSIVFEAEPSDAGSMARPPRPARAPLFDRPLVLWSLLQGASVLAASFVLFGVGLARAAADGGAHARTLAFVTLLCGGLALIAVNRSWTAGAAAGSSVRNPAQLWVAAGSLALLALSLLLPAARELLRFAPVEAPELALAAIVGLAAPLWFALLKRVRPAWLGLLPARAPDG